MACTCSLEIVIAVPPPPGTVPGSANELRHHPAVLSQRLLRMLNLKAGLRTELVMAAMQILQNVIDCEAYWRRAPYQHECTILSLLVTARRGDDTQQVGWRLIWSSPGDSAQSGIRDEQVDLPSPKAARAEQGLIAKKRRGVP